MDLGSCCRWVFHLKYVDNSAVLERIRRVALLRHRWHSILECKVWQFKVLVRVSPVLLEFWKLARAPTSRISTSTPHSIHLQEHATHATTYRLTRAFHANRNHRSCQRIYKHPHTRLTAHLPSLAYHPLKPSATYPATSKPLPQTLHSIQMLS